MSDPHHAAELFEQALVPLLPGHPPSCLAAIGREIHFSIIRRLAASGLEVDHVEDLLQEVLLGAVRHLERHGAASVSNPRAWLHAVARNATYHYLRRRFGTEQHRRPDQVSLDELFEGGNELHLPRGSEPLTLDDDNLERMLIKAIRRLQGRHREFAERRLLRGESREEIREAMRLPSARSLKRLEKRTLELLVEVFKVALAYSLASACVA